MKVLSLVVALVSLAAAAAETGRAIAAEALPVGIVAEKPAEGRWVECSRGYMVPYTQTIPGTKITFAMSPVPGGVVEVGLASGDAEGATQPISSPKRVRLKPYWVATREVTWNEYWRYMELDGVFSELKTLRNLLASENAEGTRGVLSARKPLWSAVQATPSHVDGVTAPTPLYDPSSTYESGEEPLLPAVTMSAYAAKQYTKWMSAITGSDYRLPTEAEWEHAAYAGGKSPFGNGGGGEAIDADNLGDYAWTTANSDYTAREVGGKRPNAWGLYDMIGNAAEWVLDGPSEPAEGDQPDKSPTSDSPLSWRQTVAWPTSPDPRIAKGGFWDAEPADCRIVSRMLSNDEEWKESDPNYPKSPWWFTEYPTVGIGFRIVRPLDPMSDEVKRLVWETDHEQTREDVATRLEEGRGNLQRVDASLPEVLEQLKEPAVRKLIE